MGRHHDYRQHRLGLRTWIGHNTVVGTLSALFDENAYKKNSLKMHNTNKKKPKMSEWVFFSGPVAVGVCGR